MKDKIYILGPCAAESESQLIEVASSLSECLTDGRQVIFRAGLWKPRTSPLSFQGVGEVGLKWLETVRSRYHLPVATEVATPLQVRVAMEAKIDYLWIGARTSANPIAVSEIATAIRELPLRPKAVFVKNPVNEDVALWMGNIDRFMSAGIPVMAIHRGCSHRPCWEMPFMLRKHCAELPILLDPSHLSGDANQVEELSRTAWRLGFDGLMIETHPRPSQALSDAKQQITPQEVRPIMEQFSREIPHVDDLTWLRLMIDEVDSQLWLTIQKRMEICRQIGTWKKENNIPVLQTDRYHAIVGQRKDWARKEGLSEKLVETIMDAIHNESIRVQQ